ncbi:MAG: flagellar hook-length control protein FliK [Candidatus Abyssobacteria bacterium SURF_17]|uniref:Flagellar hook-length control protein FliK n=1 Tax=Candidatus Abyssobacteria bacterium SURF_17 TaxID=2093361 RepID=A0A419F4P9_9BACT|nr:MAG: flagellar hook-length control protein FliK [Candidatus Abyssubacteria bacterium SURF_17]
MKVVDDALFLRKMGAQAVQDGIVQAADRGHRESPGEVGDFERVFQTAVREVEQRLNRSQEGQEVDEPGMSMVGVRKRYTAWLAPVAFEPVSRDATAQNTIVQPDLKQRLDVVVQMGETLDAGAQERIPIELTGIPAEPIDVPEAPIAAPAVEDAVVSVKSGNVPNVADKISVDSFSLPVVQWDYADEFIAVLEPINDWNPVKFVVRDSQPTPQAPPAETAAAPEAAVHEADVAVLMELFGSREDALQTGKPVAMEGMWGERHFELLPHDRSTVVPTALLGGTSERIFVQQAAPAMTSVSQAGLEHVFDTIVQSVRLAQSGETTEMQVRLKPEFLGRLSIRVSADEHGLRIEIKADNAAVRQVMQDNMADLQQRLNEKGIAFHQLSILTDTGSGSRKEPLWPHDPSPSRAEGEIEVEPEAVSTTALGRRDVIIDYLA